MSTISLTIEIDVENESLRIEGEHSLLFYTVWQKMMMKAKAEEQEECVDAIRECIRKHPASGAVLDAAIAAVRFKDKE